MDCPRCGIALPDGARFCMECGAATARRADEAAPGGPAPPPPPAPPAAARAPEHEVWRGAFSLRALGLPIAGLAGLLVLLLAGILTYHPGSTLALVALGLWLVLAGLLAVAYLRERLGVSYRLSTERLFVDRGILRRRTNEMELLRVDDVAVHQNLVQRLLGVGSVLVLSKDRTDPELAIRGIADPFAVKEAIRQNVRALRKTTLFVESL